MRLMLVGTNRVTAPQQFGRCGCLSTISLTVIHGLTGMQTGKPGSRRRTLLL